MNSLTRLYLGFSWSVLFIIVYVVLLFVIIVRSNKKIKKLSVELQQHIDEPEEVTGRIQQYIRKHPLSLANSTLRLFSVPYLFAPEKREKLKTCVKKIRAMDIDLGAADRVLITLFLLKEYGFYDEYLLLKTKVEKSYKPCQGNPYHLLMQEKINVENLPSDIAAVCSEQVRAVIAYYRGEDDFRKGNKEQAAKQFEFLMQVLPMTSSLLKGKGYIE